MATDTMTTGVDSPYFSIIISTRNRAILFETALKSVVSQSFGEKEIIVVVDGSNEDELQNYQLLESKYPSIHFHYLVHRPNGHGQSYSMNYGAAQARGAYLCFLDDDDYWTDEEYLSRTHDSIVHASESVDLHYSNQRAFFADGREQLEDVWLEDLIPLVETATAQKKTAHNTRIHRNETYYIDAPFIMQSQGFGHLNCSIFSQELYTSIGGMDETIRYENDRDMFIRAVDSAGCILFSTRNVSRHHIPDAQKRQNMSTVASAVDKKLFQLRVYDKGICMGQQRCITDHCLKGKVYELKHITQILTASRDFRGAAHYARAALLNGFNLRWLGYTVYLTLKALLS